MNASIKINVKGIVQGVGFRPFVYHLSKRYGLSGYVCNSTSGVSIEIEGQKSKIDEFIGKIKTAPPPQAVIFEITSSDIEPVGYDDFVIRPSDDLKEKFVPISPEIATCTHCLAELFDPSDRRYRYPFINCTNCGPRFTIVKDVPYDRKFTTMAPFKMCRICQKEYDDPYNRRFHAQPNACPVCGPGLTLLNDKLRKIDVPDVISEVCRLLKDGNVIAIKGLGGYHLACDAQNPDAVFKLRSRKYREYKPFAIMVKDIEAAKRLCYVNEKEEKALTGSIRPIVLLRKRPGCSVAEDVAPHQKYHGVMLPYTPLHHLIVEESGLVLVMTSGNMSSEPIAYHDEQAFDRLKNIADFYCIHNREIHIRTDDSVIRVWRGNEIVFRRARGFAPFPLVLNFRFQENVLACGSELKNSFCLGKDNFAFMSHHIGDLENLETLTSFEEGLEHFQRIFNISPTLVAYDLHPDYLATKYALALEEIPKIGVQHHHAHIVSCMVDNEIDGEVIGVSFDGTGYGTDGTIWGGEFLICDYKEFKRVGHLEYTPLPGGEMAIKEPWRMAASYLYNIYHDDVLDLDIDFVKRLDREKWATIKKMIDKGINSPMTSSSGRLFDAVSALLGIRKEIYYEGQAAIELEMAAGPEEGGYPFDLKDAEDKVLVLLEPLFKGIVSDLERGVEIESIASRFHNTIARMILSMCLKLKSTSGLDRVVLSGGVFQNHLLLEKTYVLLDKNDFKVFTHHRVPPNDGGIALGQAVVASERTKKGYAF
jgi:hydrogenase maturation protein HypF